MKGKAQSGNKMVYERERNIESEGEKSLLLEVGFLMAMPGSSQLKHWSTGAPGTDLRKKLFSSAQSWTV